MFELVSVAAVPGSASRPYMEGLENYYRTMAENSVLEMAPQKPLNGAMPIAEASAQMWEIMKQKKRLEYGQ